MGEVGEGHNSSHNRVVLKTLSFCHFKDNLPDSFHDGASGVGARTGWPTVSTL